MKKIQLLKVFSGILLISMILVTQAYTRVYGATGDGYWQLSDTIIDSKDYRAVNGTMNTVTEIVHGGPEDGFDAVVEMITTESFGNGKYKAGLKWAQLPTILVPGEKYKLELQLTEIESNTKLMIGAAANMFHGISSIPSPPGKPGGQLNISTQTFTKEGKTYSQQSLEFTPFPKQRDINDPYIIRVRFTADSTKDYYNYDVVYRWVSGAVPADDTIKVILGGEPLMSDVPPMIISGRTFLPLRSILEALGTEVSWSSETRTVTATKGSTKVQLVIDSKNANVNGEFVALDVPAQIVNGRTLVPVRFLSETFGAKVDWNGTTRTITIE